MRENIKNIGLIIALVIAGISLPIGIIGFNKKPIIINETIIEKYYYNETIIERYNETIIEYYNETIIEYYNETIIINNTIIEEYYYNETIIINNTIYEFPNCTMEFYSFDDIEHTIPFFNKTYNITEESIIVIAMTANSGHCPQIHITENGVKWAEINGIMFYFIVAFGIYNIQLILGYTHLPDYDINLFIGIFW